MESSVKNASTAMVVAAFSIVYIVWGSTYFFIRMAIEHVPALMLVSLRFVMSGGLMLIWCVIKKEKLFTWSQLRPAIISGLLLLGIGNGVVVWSEKYLPSSLVAVFAAISPMWVVILDKRNWSLNFRSRPTVIGLIMGFAGVVMLFSENALQSLSASGNHMQLIAMVCLVFGTAGWGGGSLYAKYNSKGPAIVSTAWQMFAAGLAFIPVSAGAGEWKTFHWNQITTSSWLAVFYLVVMGSLVAYSAYVWLLKVRTPTQVSTHAYVNPVVAVLLGTLLANEKITVLQLCGLAVILLSVLLINLAKYRKAHAAVNSGTNQPLITKAKVTA